MNETKQKLSEVDEFKRTEWKNMSCKVEFIKVLRSNFEIISPVLSIEFIANWICDLEERIEKLEQTQVESIKNKKTGLDT